MRFARQRVLKLHDPVALLVDLPDQNLSRGQVGAIVEVYDNGAAFEVDFVDRDGLTYAILTLPNEHLMLLHYEPAESI